MADEDEGPAIQVRRASVMRGEVASASDLGEPAPSPPAETPVTPAPAPELGLELGRSRPSKSNPELDEWNREFSTGEFKVPELPEEGGAGEAPAALPFASSSPKTDPGPATGSSPIGKIAVAVVVLLAVGGIGAKLAWSKLSAKPAVAEAPSGEGTVSDDFVRQMQAAGENAPDCWSTDDGYEFVYKDNGGEMTKVDRIRDVPVLHRKNAICVPQ